MNRQQKILISAVLAAGVLLAALILWPASHSADDGHEHNSSGPRPQASAAAKDSDEGEIDLSPEQIALAGIETVTAGPATLTRLTQLPGEIRLNEDRTAHIVARVEGVVENVPARLGQLVQAGERLAVIASPSVANLRATLSAAEKRQQLAAATFRREQQLWQDRISAEQDFLAARQALAEADIEQQSARAALAASGVTPDRSNSNRFELRAPFAGTLIEKHLTLGEAVTASDQAFVLSDLSTVWATLTVPAAQLGDVRTGSTVTVRASAFDSVAEGRVAYVGSLLGSGNRSAEARVTLKNPDGIWRPGLFVTVEMASGTKEAAVSVPAGAIQTVDNRPTVFVRSSHGFSARAVTLGLSDGKQTEITDGLRAGETVASRNSFVLKAELGKGEAGHEH